MTADSTLPVAGGDNPNGWIQQYGILTHKGYMVQQQAV